MLLIGVNYQTKLNNILKTQKLQDVSTSVIVNNLESMSITIEYYINIHNILSINSLAGGVEFISNETFKELVDIRKKLKVLANKLKK